MRRLVLIGWAAVAAGCGASRTANTPLTLKAAGAIDASTLVDGTSASVNLTFNKPAPEACVIFEGLQAEFDGQPANVNKGGWANGPSGTQGCSRPTANVSWTTSGVHHLRFFDDSASLSLDLLVPLADSARLLDGNEVRYPSPDGGSAFSIAVEVLPLEAVPDGAQIVVGEANSVDLATTRVDGGAVEVALPRDLGLQLSPGDHPAKLGIFFRPQVTACGFATCNAQVTGAEKPAVLNFTLKYGP